ncbi:MAG TPA: hypothetical protein ENO33_01000 [Hydrogenobaculum sp.]|nr:hypothetical protein [Hydrogenobaculum sp.]
MKKIEASKLFLGAGLLSGFIVASCGGGGGSGNGVSTNGAYQLSVYAYPVNTVYAVNPDGSISSDTIGVNATINFVGSSSSLAPLSYGIIESSSICFSDPSIPFGFYGPNGSKCFPLVFQSNSIPTNGTVSGSFIGNYYKYGAIALQANPFQNTPSNTMTLSLTPMSGYKTSYQPGSTINLLNQNLIPGYLQVQFNVVYQDFLVNNVYEYSISSASNSWGIASNTFSSSSYIGSYTVSGICIDNGKGGFYPNASTTTVGLAPYNNFSNIGITCSGSINYKTGQIISFSIIAPSYSVISYTSVSISGSADQNSSGYTEYLTVISNSFQDPYYLPNINVYYGYVYGSTTSLSTPNVYYAYIPNQLIGPYSYSLLPLSVNLNGTNYPCSQFSQLECNIYSNGLFNVFSVTLPYSFSYTNVSAQILQEFTYNPSVVITNHQLSALLPYTVYMNVLMEDGQTMSTNYTGNLLIQSPSVGAPPQ